MSVLANETSINQLFGLVIDGVRMKYRNPYEERKAAAEGREHVEPNTRPSWTADSDRLANTRGVRTKTSPAQRSTAIAKAALGFSISAIIMIAFHNIQAVSDLAPEAVRDSNMPGLYGAPIAIISMLWIVLIIAWFGISIFINLPRGRLSPGSFVSGAFVAVAIGLFLA